MPAIDLEKDDNTDKTFAVKVFTTGLDHPYGTPWGTPEVKTWTGSGFVIDGRKIITNAHVAGNARTLEVQLANDTTKYEAKIISAGHDCDLAVITVEDEEFWEKAKPIPIGDNAAHTQKVEAHGFPTGGKGYCITEGSVSRMERHIYVHGETNHFTYQTSAAINPGNSGGAVVSTNPKTGAKEVVGVAFQGMPSGQNIAYVIPAAVLKHFLAQVSRKEMGFPGLAITTQEMENPYIRKKYGLKPKQTGVLVEHITKLSCAKGKLHKGDIILSINDIPVQNDGSVNLKGIKKINFNYIINNCHLGETATFKVLRDGEELLVPIKLRNREGSTRLVKPMEYDKAPTYYVIGGLIPVQPVTRNLMYATKTYYPDEYKEHMDDELLVVNRVLTKGDYTKGYNNADYAKKRIVSVNGHAVANMQDIIRATETNTEPDHTIVVIDEGEKRRLVIPRLNAAQVKETLKFNGIPSDRSEDLIPEIQKKERLLQELLEAAGKTLTFSERPAAPKLPKAAEPENSVPKNPPAANDDVKPPKHKRSVSM